MHNAVFGEFLGTMVLILLGNGVVANVLLKKSKAEGAGWMVIATGWALGVMAGVFTSIACGGEGHLNPLSEKYKTHQGEGGHRSMTRNTIATGKTDAMTAGGQMPERGHNEELPPVTFRIDIPVMAVRVSGSNPSRTGAWRHFPPTRLPSVGVAIPAVISPNPDVISAWTKGAMLPNANRRPKPDNDLRMSRYQP